MYYNYVLTSRTMDDAQCVYYFVPDSILTLFSIEYVRQANHVLYMYMRINLI